MTKYLKSFEILTLLIITILGIIQGQVTVFYIIYLFWFQELIRTLVDLFHVVMQKKTAQDKINVLRLSIANFFLLFVYLVFIVVLFGFMLNWSDSERMGQNILVVIFRNWYFNLNILLFGLEYIYYRNQTDNSNLELQPFNRRHIILHISIILGAFMQMAIAPRLHIEGIWVSVITVAPFLLLKICIDKPMQYKHAQLLNKLRR